MNPSTLTTDTVLPLLAPVMMRDIAYLVAESVLYGMYLILIPVALRHLLQKGRTLAAASVAMFALATFLWASKTAVFARRFDILLHRTDGTIVSRLALANASTQELRYMSDVMFVIMYLIGDAAIMYRVLVLWNWSLSIAATLGILWLGSFATGFALVGCLVRAHFPPSDLLPRLCTNLENTSWLISLVLNGLATALLAHKAWSHRRDAGRVLAARHRTRVDRALLVFAASSAAYLLLGVPRLASFANPSLNPLPVRVTYATQLIEAMLYQVVGLYPTVVTAFMFYESTAAVEPRLATASTLLDAPGSEAADATARRSCNTLADMDLGDLEAAYAAKEDCRPSVRRTFTF